MTNDQHADIQEEKSQNEVLPVQKRQKNLLQKSSSAKSSVSKKDKIEESSAKAERVQKKEVISGHSRHQKRYGFHSSSGGTLTEKINH